jgi:peptidoglycan/LPS O-acetylase OafA/YrhL
MIEILTALRSFALFAIFIHHVEYFSGFAAIAVTFFFVLSGFVLTYTYNEKFVELKADKLKEFYLFRLARIFPLHILTFFASVPIMWVSKMQYTFWDGLVHFFLLQSYLPIGSKIIAFNSVSWAISTEVFFYLCFPFLIFLFHKMRVVGKPMKLIALWIMLCIAMIVIGLLEKDQFTKSSIGYWIIYISPFVRLIDFIVGMASGFLFIKFKNLISVQKKRTIQFTCFELGAVLALFAAYFSPYFKYVSLQYDAYYLPFVSLLIFVFAFEKGFISLLLSRRFLIHLGKISFPFYLVHQLVIRAVYVSGFHSMFGRNQSWQQLMMQTLVFTVSVGLSEILYHYVEIPVYLMVRNWKKEAFLNSVSVKVTELKSILEPIVLPLMIYSRKLILFLRELEQEPQRSISFRK